MSRLDTLHSDLDSNRPNLCYGVHVADTFKPSEVRELIDDTSDNVCKDNYCLGCPWYAQNLKEKLNEFEPVE